jgi:hypothetical protein
MASFVGSRVIAPVGQSFSNLPANFTTPNFIMPKGLVEMVVNAVDPNNPGITTLQAITNAGATTTALFTVTTSQGDIPGFTGSGWIVLPPGNNILNITTTAALQSVLLYFMGNDTERDAM